MTCEQEIKIISMRNNGVKLKNIMSDFNIKSVKTIYDIIKRNGIKKIGNKKYNVNDTYFSNIDSEEKAYWLGFLYADGYVRMKNGRSGELKLKLSKKDRDHVELFNRCLESDYPIKDSVSSVLYKSSKSLSNVSEVSIFNTRIVKDLISVGCLNNKTFLIRLPRIDSSLYRHFIRGYFDGDGCIYKIKNRPNSFSLQIASNFEFLSDIKNIIGYGTIRKSGNIYILTILRIEEILNFYYLIYEDSTIFLKRKKEIFEKIKNKK